MGKFGLLMIILIPLILLIIGLLLGLLLSWPVSLVGWALLVIGGIFLLYVVLIYNHLIRRRNNINNAWAQIDVQTKRRADLVPNLVETVKGYMKHEKGVFMDVTKARTAWLSAQTVQQKAAADNLLSGALKSLFAVAEGYPQLQSSQNFMSLQEELSGIESKIAFSRQFFNDNVLSYNNAINTFPGNIFADAFDFEAREYYKPPEGAALERAPKVSF